jgi:three-Cys-motif partner protein
VPSVGRTHFDAYTAQNRVKHAILSKYFAAYLKALSSRADAFHYIDAFAGPGTYAEINAGSPLYALDLLSKQTKPYAASFVESDTDSYSKLERAVVTAPAGAARLEAPWLRNAEFAACVDEILARPAFRAYRAVATFAFVDPWGLKGVYISDFAKILSKPFGECLALFNYDGLNRWLGGVRAGTHERDKLDRFFGSHEAASSALACLSGSTAGIPYEPRLLDIYVQAVREKSGAKYVLPFRFQAAERDRTSHYLIHLAQHPLAFKIMKDVMKSESAGTHDFGHLGFIPQSELVGQGELFQPNSDRAKAEILAALRSGPRPVSLFTKHWIERPNDMFVEKEYKRLLLELERDLLLEVIDGRTREPAPAASRRKKGGSPTLGDAYLVRERVD